MQVGPCMIYLDPSQRDSLGGGQAEGLSPLYRCHAGSERPVVLSKVIVLAGEQCPGLECILSDSS